MIILFDYDTQELSQYPDFSKIDKLSMRLGDVVRITIAITRRRVVIDPPCGEMPIFILKGNSSDSEYLVLQNEFEKAKNDKIGTVFNGLVRLNTNNIIDEIGDKKSATLVGEFVLITEEGEQHSSKLIPIEISTDLYKGTEAPPPQVIPQWKDDVATIKRCANEVMTDKGIVLESVENSKRLAESAEESNVAATAAKGATEQARDKSQKWSEEAVDIPVDGEGKEAKYSSKHWASKSADEATEATKQARNAENSSKAARDAKESAQGAAESAGQAAEVALAKAGRVEELHRQVVTLEASAAASAANATASANSASATLKSAIKTGQLETATLGGGLTVAGEIIAQSPPKSMNAALRLDDTLAGLILPKKLDVQLDVSRLPMIGTGAKNHYFGIDFGNPSSDQVKGVKIPGLYYQQSWGAAALIIELTQWFGANLYICVRRPSLTDNTPINTMVTEHDRVIDGSAQFAFIARAETQTYDLDCMSQDDTLTQHKPVCSYPSHDGCMRLIVTGRKGSSMIDLYMCNNNDCMFTNSGINYRPRKIGEAALETGEYRIQVLIGMLAGGVLGGAGHAYRYRTPYLSRVTWLFGNDITSKIQQLVL